MRWLRLSLLLLLASCCFAQDGVPPDTIYTFGVGVYAYPGGVGFPWCADIKPIPQADCVFYGDCIGVTSCLRLESYNYSSLVLQTCADKDQFLFNIWYTCRRGYALFDTKFLLGFDPIDSLDIMFSLESINNEDGDSLFIVPFLPREENSPYDRDYSHLSDLCNYWKCGVYTWDINNYYFGENGVDLAVGWNVMRIDTSFLNTGDTTGIGFTTRLGCLGDGSDSPQKHNVYTIGSWGDAGSLLVRLIYYWTPPNPFDLLSPSNSKVVCTNDVDFVWEASSCPDPADSIDYYRLYIADDADFSVNLDSVQTGGTDTTYTWGGLTANGAVFWWRVKAFDSQGFITTSDSEWMFYHSICNDISHQDNADGISPDTIQFICSIANDDISTPGYWSRAGYDWNLAPSTDDDALHGEWLSAFSCDTSRTGQWNYAMQPHVEASFYSGTSIYWMRRAYYLMELEKQIPDTTELDSMRFYLKFNYVHVDEGDSLFVVTYTPRDTGNGECYINYRGDWDPILKRFTYPIIYEGTAAPTKWCNFYKCGEDYIWGDIPDRSYGRVPQYLAWTWFPIHPSIIDFHTASIGDTFGIGLILRDGHNPAPTDTNDISIATGADCPYIVYWFSEPEAEAGFINWGLPAHHSNYGLPIQARRMYGGGKGR